MAKKATGKKMLPLSGKEISITDLLPVKPSQAAVDVYRERQDHYSHIIMSYGEAYQRLQKMAVHRPKDGAQLPALRNNSKSVSLRHNQDAFAELREKLGLNERREQLENELAEAVSFEEGLSVFNKTSPRSLHRKFHSIEELNEIFPHLTMLEVAFLSLIKYAPEFFFIYGTSHYPKLENRQIPLDCQSHVPMHFSSNVMSLMFTTDVVNTDRGYTGISYVDPYEFMGFTGIKESTEFVPLKSFIKILLDSLIPLIVSNKRLHECVWFCGSEAVSVGFGKIAAEVYRQIVRLPPHASVGTSIMEAIEKLSPEMKIQFESLREAVEKTAYQAVTFDLARECTMREDEIFKLIGILRSVPACLIGETPFRGYVTPYGVGVKFINQQGRW